MSGKAALILVLSCWLWPMLPLWAQAQPGPTRLQRLKRPMQHAMLLGDARHTGLSHQEAPRHGRLLWTRRLPGGVIASPTADAQGNTWWTTQAGTVHVLNPQGQQIRQHTLRGPSHSTPALLRGGAAVLATLDGEVLLLEPGGGVRWRTTIGQELLSSPALDEASGRVYLSTGDQTVALGLAHGELLFRYSMGNGANNSSPALGGDGLVRVTNWRGLAAAISGSGAEAWRITLAPGSGFLASPTLGPQGQMYTAGRLGALFALDPQGRPLWSLPLGQSVDAFLGLLPSGEVVVPGGRELMAVRPDGTFAWRRPLLGERATSSPLISRDGVIFLGTDRGNLWAVDDKGEVLWRHATGEAVQSTPILVTPPVGGTRLLVGNRSGLVSCLR